MHTRKSDEELIIEFIMEDAWDQPDLVEAACRLKDGLDEGLQDYSIPETPSSPL